MPTAVADPLPMFTPTVLSLCDGVSTSWIQVAKTGKFFSNRYGTIAITPKDLEQMLHNFRHVTPIAPTQIPVDYDHLSMNPKAPGDGKAAGWFSGTMELRNGGNELWAEVDWTDDAASAIRKKEYRFVSPSFIRDYVWKTGENIGTTLLAAAITNHPFLEGMSAVTLCSDPALVQVIGMPVHDGAIELMDVGQMVGLKSDVCLDEDERPADEEADDDPKAARRARVDARAAETYSVMQVVGVGNDQFALLETAEGHRVGWYRANELVPAKAPAASEDPPLDKRQEATIMADVFNLRRHDGQEVEVKAEELQKFLSDQVAAAKAAGTEEGKQAAVPDGSTVITMAKLGEFETTGREVVSLRATVDALAADNDKRTKDLHAVNLTRKLDLLGDRLTKPQRDWALETFGADASQMVSFDKWAQTIPAVSVVPGGGREHGTAGHEGAAEGADGELMQAARDLQDQARTRGVSLSMRDAIRQASTQRVDLSEQFHNEVRGGNGRGARSFARVN